MKDPKHKKLFTEGGFKPHRGARYHTLVKRYNVFIEYYNGMNKEFYDRGDISQEIKSVQTSLRSIKRKDMTNLKRM